MEDRLFFSQDKIFTEPLPRDKMRKTRAVKSSESLEDTSVRPANLYSPCCQDKHHVDPMVKSHSPFDRPRSNSSPNSTDQGPRALKETPIHQKSGDGRNTYASSNAKSKAGADVCISADGRKCCRRRDSSENGRSTNCPTLYVDSGKLRPVICPLDTNFLMPPPSPLQLDGGSRTPPTTQSPTSN